MIDPQVVLPAVLHRLGVIEGRLELIETGRRLVTIDDAQRAEAIRTCKLLGFKGVPRPGRTREREQLANALRARSWSYQEIAHALRCSERTVERYFAPSAPSDRL